MPAISIFSDKSSPNHIFVEDLIQNKASSIPTDSILFSHRYSSDNNSSLRKFLFLICQDINSFATISFGLPGLLKIRVTKLLKLDFEATNSSDLFSTNFDLYLKYESQNPINYESSSSSLFLKYEAQADKPITVDQIMKDTKYEKRKLLVLHELEDIFNSQPILKKKVPEDSISNFFNPNFLNQAEKSNESLTASITKDIDDIDTFFDSQPNNSTSEVHGLTHDFNFPVFVDKEDNNLPNAKKTRPSAAKDFKGLICNGFGLFIEKYLNTKQVSNFFDELANFKWILTQENLSNLKKEFAQYVNNKIKGKTNNGKASKFKISTVKDIENQFHSSEADDDMSRKCKEMSMIMFDYFINSNYYNTWLFEMYDCKKTENIDFFKNNRKEILKVFLYPIKTGKFVY